MFLTDFLTGPIPMLGKNAWFQQRTWRIYTMASWSTCPLVPKQISGLGRNQGETPAVGPLPSELALPALQRLRLRLTPAQKVPICLWCPTSCASTRLSSGHSPPSATECAACTLRRSNCRCHFSSPKSLAVTVSYSKAPSFQPCFKSTTATCPNAPAGRRLAAE